MTICRVVAATGIRIAGMKNPAGAGFFAGGADAQDHSSKSIQPPISFQRLTMPQNSSAVFSVS